jgi:hypothetical protein
MKHYPIRSLFRLFVTLCIIAISMPLSAFAMSTVTISSDGPGVFLLQGMGIEGASALEINILYDANTLANPRVVEGPLISGSMTAINQNIPGMVRMVIVRLSPIQGSGIIATLSFDRKGLSPGIITSMNVRLANINGSPLAAAAQITNSPNVANAQDQNITTGATTSALAGTPGTTSDAYVIPSTVIIAGQPSGAEAGTKTADATLASKVIEGQPAVTDSVGSSVHEPAAPPKKNDHADGADDQKAPRVAKKPIYTQQSVLDRFKEYRGERTISSLVSLFENESMIGCRQEPPVSISDGRSSLRVVFVTTPGANPASDMAVMGARLISLKKDTDNTNTWIAELVPEKGTFRASLAVTQGGLKMIIPLTVTPKIKTYHARPRSWTAADFEYYLKRHRADLNNDGKRDYIDDYVFTANYLYEIVKTQQQRQKPIATVAGQ